ncbi:unnamed protein product [Hyaloperonospora brassicae]|uniref:Uncharacterized protein n=1 Tax=Hyaloperonospora brassicae TaxID=162125 RepID=A0AAV0UTG8_HYABA|nr:unnamed protein product [Hyaloperonospora brassicae]
MSPLLVFKLVSLGSIWLVGLIGGLTPALLASKHDKSPVLSILSAFSGGVFLAGGFLHLLHAAIENSALRQWSTMDGGRYAFPYAEMFCTVGFLGLLLLEQAAQAHLVNDWTRHDVGPWKQKKSEDLLDEELYGVRESGGTYVEHVDDEEQRLKNEDRRHVSHAHGYESASKEAASPAVAMVLFLALSFHSVLEGLGIGAQTETAWGVFLAIVMHKGLAAFALGSELVQSRAMALSRVMLYMVVFSFMSIVGILVGWTIVGDSSEESAAAGICVALASGTFIYVAVMEVIPHEFPQHSHASGLEGPRHQQAPKQTLTKSLALVAGYAIFGLLAKWA